jgi:uncharacterized protein YbbC (DUF1343 family)
MNQRVLTLALTMLPLVTPALGQQRLPQAAPADVGLDEARLVSIDAAVEAALDAGRMPGCVVCIGRRGSIVLLRAYGFRQVEPTREPMTTDTVFDLASLTKPVATATSVMRLVEDGRVRLRDRVSKHVPEFGRNAKERITIEDLLLHRGGLIPDNPISDYTGARAEMLERIWDLAPHVEPGTRFVYTDVGFIVLGELVHRVSGRPLDEFTTEEIFAPLGMTETGFRPGEGLCGRAATTERREGRWLRGEVHDPRAYRLRGVAGHAGLFSTAEDVALYAQMMLDGGRLGDTRVLSARAVEVMTRGRDVSGDRRALGWDKQSRYSSNRGELFTDAAFGHGGFTGTVLWIDPGLDLFVVFLSNRVHPDGKGLVNPLAGAIGTIAASAILEPQDPALPLRGRAGAPVLTGIDVLRRDGFAPLEGARVGLITNHTGRDSRGVSTARLLHAAPNVELIALFSPEHGPAGRLDEGDIPDGTDPETGRPVFSLYGQTRQPTDAQLAGIDTLVFDIQDVGTRFYTYVSTMGEAMRAASTRGLRFVVLDRPNPINGVDVEGPMLDAGRESFVAFHRLPLRHGLTVGELARLFDAELGLGLDPLVVAVEGWRRDDYYDATGLPWVDPSPNMRSLRAAVLYPGIGLLETTNLSVGRGTDTPFEVIGAPWLDGTALATALAHANLPGVAFVPIRFTPTASTHAGGACGGVSIIVTDRARFRSVRTGLEIACRLRELHPDEWEAAKCDRLLGSRSALEALLDGACAAEIETQGETALASFRGRREPILLYD